MSDTENNSLASEAQRDEPKSADVVAIAKEYPLLWERAVTADTRDRLGQSVQPLDAECDAVLREIWMARAALARLVDAPSDCKINTKEAE